MIDMISTSKTEGVSIESVARRTRVLIFYANMGAGHRSVALSIRAAMHALATERGMTESGSLEWQTYLHDPIAEGNSRFLQRLFGLYAPVTRHMPALFAGTYHLADSEAMCSVISKAMSGLLDIHLCHVLRTAQPDIVVCVNSLLIAPVLHAMKRCAPSTPLFTVVTDLASIHHSWAVPGVDICFVPTADACKALIEQGIPAEKVRLSGLPIHPAYRSISDDSSREAIRQSLGLHPELFTVLITGGGEGVGRLEAISGALERSGLPVQIVIVTGRNRALYRRLMTRQYSGNVPLKVYGYTSNMPALIRASNVIITKGGSVTLAEALSCGMPVVLSSVIGGQESGNIDFVIRNRIGAVARTDEEAIRAVKRLLSLSEREQEALGQRARRLSIPDASSTIARAIVQAWSATEQGQLR